MYDFYFGEKDTIDKDPWSWLLNIKRMLPRWINGIPDSEFRALYDLLLEAEEGGSITPDGSMVLAETGSGASTIILLYFAIRWNTEVYTWDISSTKLAYLRGVLTDTLFRHYTDKNIYSHWKYVAFSSIDDHAGIPILGELDKQVCGCFFDSEHTWQTLGKEIGAIIPRLSEGAVVAIDDGNYRHKNRNSAYINMLRTKLGLPKAEFEDNVCGTFWQETENLLRQHFAKVMNMEGGTYRKTFQDDVFWQYYEQEKKNAAALDMEKLDDLAHRFDAWRVYRND